MPSESRRGSSVVEHSPEERLVGCSIHPRGTRIKCGYSTMVVHLVANQSTGVRFPLPAQEKNPGLSWIFRCG